jgi:hypothetical protein
MFCGCRQTPEDREAYHSVLNRVIRTLSRHPLIEFVCYSMCLGLLRSPLSSLPITPISRQSSGQAISPARAAGAARQLQVRVRCDSRKRRSSSRSVVDSVSVFLS